MWVTSQWLYWQSQDKRTPPARAHAENLWLKATCTPLLCELWYLIEGQFATLKLLKQSTNSGALDSGKNKYRWFLTVDFLNVCNATQVLKRFSTNAQRMHHRCTMDAPWMYNGSTKDARWTHNGCCLNALRMHHEFIHMYYGCARNAPQMHFEHTMGTPGMPHACFTDAPRILFRCTLNALRLSTDVSRVPHRYVCTMDSVRMQCLLWSWVIVLGQSCLFIYLFVYLFS